MIFQRSECEASDLRMAGNTLQTNEDFIKACRDGDLDRYNELVSQADVNYVSESGESVGGDY